MPVCSSAVTPVLRAASPALTCYFDIVSGKSSRHVWCRLTSLPTKRPWECKSHDSFLIQTALLSQLCVGDGAHILYVWFSCPFADGFGNKHCQGFFRLTLDCISSSTLGLVSIKVFAIRNLKKIHRSGSVILLVFNHQYTNIFEGSQTCDYSWNLASWCNLLDLTISSHGSPILTEKKKDEALPECFYKDKSLLV